MRLRACEAALEPSGRVAVFEGRMARAERGQRLQMRFALQVRTPGGAGWRPVAAAGFGTWYTAARNVARWTYEKRVEDLLAPASYRAEVRFRWRDGDGRIVRRATVVSGICRQPDPRPDLRAGALTLLPAQGAAVRYQVPVRNAGRNPAGPAELTLEAAGNVLTAPVPPLAPGGQTTVQARGPACSLGSAVVLTLDPSGRIDEAGEEDNRRVIACPAG